MSTPAGISWVAQFPTSILLSDLASPFRESAGHFLEELEAGGAACHVSATYRPIERAYLMHWSCMIALSGQDPEAVPALAGVDIDWTCAGDRDHAKAAAAAMIKGYGIAFPAALVSRHTQRRALDVTINIPPRPERLYQFKGGDGKVWMFGAGDALQLHRFGASFGVIKLLSDPPHWSDDGH